MIRSLEVVRWDELRRHDGLAALGAVGLVLLAAVLLSGIGLGLFAPELALVTLGAIVAVALTAWRPAAGLALLVVSVPLTTGLGRGTIIPLLRLHEAMTLLVLAGLLLHHLPRRTRRPYTGIDLAVVSFTAGTVLIPTFYILVTRSEASLDTWRTVLAPAQYLALYLMFSRAGMTTRHMKTILNLAMAASIVVALVAAAQLANLPGVRDFLATYYPLRGGLCQGSVCRPTSLLEHWNSVGALGVLTFALALALATARHPSFSGRWLGLVMAVNAVGMVVSQTQAALVSMVLATGVILWHGRRIPRQLSLSVAALVLGLVLFFPQVTARVEQQLGVGPGQALATPESLQLRIRFWDEFFVPAFADHLWFGTGTILPSDIPERRASYVDNEYLRLGFRAGVVGEALLGVMLVAIVVGGWRMRNTRDPWRRGLGAACVGYVVILAVMGATGEYLTFAGVTQPFWMLVGLLTALQLAQARSQPSVLVLGPSEPRSRWQGSQAAAAVFTGVRALVTTHGLLRSSAILFVGLAAARMLALLFWAVAARMLLPTQYGLMAYALAIATVSATLITSTPLGVTGFLARYKTSPREQGLYISHWLMVVGGATGLSLTLALPIALVAGLGPGMVVAVLANLLGMACLTTYRQLQLGLERHVAVAAYYLVANILQLVAVLGMAALGWRTPVLFLTIYGLSSVAAVAVMQPFAPIAVRWPPRQLSGRRLLGIVRFNLPVALQAGFFTVWLNADLILVQRLLPGPASGLYAAAKTLVTVLYLAPSALASVVVARVAQLTDRALREYLVSVLVVTAAVTLPLLAGFLLLGRPLTGLVFGNRYTEAAQPLAVLSVGMAFHAFFLAFDSTWLGLSRPRIAASAMGVGMACTVVLALALIPHLGLIGAAWAFTAGAASQLVLIGAFTIWAIFAGRSAGAGRLFGDHAEDPRALGRIDHHPDV